MSEITIEARNLPRFRERFGKIVKRAQREGLPVPSFTSERLRKDNDQGDGQETEIHRISFSLPEVKIPGYVVRGMADFTKAEPMVFAFGEKGILELVTEGLLNPVCDHCRKSRIRNRIFLVEEEATGKALRIGSRCVELYGGIDLARKCSNYESIFGSLDRLEKEEWLRISSAWPARADFVLAVAARLMLQVRRPFVSKAAAMANLVPSTASLIAREIDERFEDRDLPEVERRHSRMAEGFLEMARKASAWTLERQEDESTNDFWKNRRSLLVDGLIEEKHVPFIAGVMWEWWKAEIDSSSPDPDVHAPISPLSNYLGIPGQCLCHSVRYVRSLFRGVSRIRGHELAWDLLLFLTPEGHSLIYKCWGSPAKWENHDGPAWFDVREHREYRGRHETVIGKMSLNRPSRA